MADDNDAEVNLDELENCMLASAHPITDDQTHTQPASLPSPHDATQSGDEGNDVHHGHPDANANEGGAERSERHHTDKHHRRHKKHRHDSSHRKRHRENSDIENENEHDDDENDTHEAEKWNRDDAAESRRARHEEKRRRREEKKMKLKLKRRSGSQLHHSDGDADADDAQSRHRHRSDRRRRHSRRRSRYVLDAAESVSDDGFVVDDDEDEEEEAEAGFDAVAAAASEPRPPRFLFHEGDDQLTAEELGREYEERVKSMRRQRRRAQLGGPMTAARQRSSQHTPVPRRLRLGTADAGHAATQSSLTATTSTAASPRDNDTNDKNMAMHAMQQQRRSSTRFAVHRLPSDSDPKVFAIKCRPRMARLLVARIVNKCYAYRVGRNYEHRRVDLGIISAFCLDHVPEYIYVEAYRKLFVEQALNGLEGLFRFQIAVVEPSELMQMMERRMRTHNRLQVGALVRLRRRRYRGDLAEVVAVHRDGQRLTCRAVPREDFVNKSYHKVNNDAHSAAVPPPPPRFFMPHLAHGVVEDRDGLLRWGELRFDRAGYILLEISARSVCAASESSSGPPSTEELARFYDNNRARVREAIARTTAGAADGAPHSAAMVVSAACSNLCMGDRVRVISGQLRDTVGTIVNIFTSNQTALLSCIVPNQSRGSTNNSSNTTEVQVRVELSACVRSFVEGTHVIVDHGEHAGESGTVVQSTQDTVLLFPDRRAVAGATELRVRANDCHQSSLMGNSFAHSRGTWRLFDLVAISEANMVACIVRLARNDVDVLTERNERRTLSYAQIKAIPNRGGGGGGGAAAVTHRTVDRWQNVLQRGCEVHIHRTPLTPFHLGGCTGRVEQVYRTTLFVHSRAMSENGGLVALSSSCVRLTGGRTTTKRVAPPRELPAPLRRAHNATRADLSAVRGEGLSNGYEDWQAQSEWYEPSLPGLM